MILFGICLSLSDLLQKYWGFSSSLSIKSLFTFYFLERIIWSSCCGSVEVNLTSNYEDTGLIPDLAEWIKVPALPWAVVYVTDSAQIWFLWLWCRQAVMAPIWTLAWELPYATCVALKRQKEKKKKNLSVYKISIPLILMILKSVSPNFKSVCYRSRFPVRLNVPGKQWSQMYCSQGIPSIWSVYNLGYIFQNICWMNK